MEERMTTLIREGRLLNPATGTDGIYDIWIENGRVQKIEPYIADKADEEIMAYGCYVMPGFIDLHVHLREPGFEYKETIETGAKAAAKGGYTTILAMPNTNPVTDCPNVVTSIINKAKEVTKVHVIPVGAVTVGQMGEQVTDIVGMKYAGIRAISEDGKSVMNAGVYREAMKVAAREDIVVLAHCEDKNMVGHGALNAGDKARQLNVEGITNSVEDVIVARDILLAKETGARLHLCHCSTKDSVRLIAEAKKEGLPVTGEICPHHFTLCEEDIPGDDANYKMNPPLRSRQDVEALKEGIKYGVIDAIATDHAPHTEEEKRQGIAYAPFGIVGLETAAALAFTELVEQGYLTPLQLVEKMSYRPAKIIGLDKGSIEVGKAADIVIFNPNEEYTINKEEFVSKGKNTPFHGRNVRGKVKYTLVEGTVVYHD